MYARHGDIIFRPVILTNQNLRGAVLRKTKEAVIAEGEQTGHAHTLTGNLGLILFQGMPRFLSAKGASVSHPEHGKLDLEDGDYEIGPRQQYEPGSDQIYAAID